MPGGCSGVTSTSAGWSLSARITFVHFSSFFSFPSHLYDSCNLSRLFSLLPPLFVFFSTFPSYTILLVYGFDLTLFDISVSHVLLPSLLSFFRFILMLLELLNFKFLFISSIDSCLLGSINLLLLSELLLFCPLFTFPFAFLPC